MPAIPMIETSCALPLFGRRVEELLDEPQLAIAADERRFEPRRPEGAHPARRDAKRAPELYRLGLALELVLADLLVGDRRLGRASRRFADEHLAGLRGGLDARCGVDEVAGDHSLALGSERDGGLSCEDPGSRAETVRADLVPERRHGGSQIEPGTHRPLGVVLARDRRSPDGHDGVADELLDCPAVALDDRPRRLEVAREQLAHVFRVAVLRHRREADEVREEDGDEAAFRSGGGLLSSGRCRCGRRRERRAAFPAELDCRSIRRST